MERITFNITLGELRNKYRSWVLCRTVAELAGVDVNDQDLYFEVNLIEVFAIRFPERFSSVNCAANNILELHWLPHPEIQVGCSIELFRTEVLRFLCETYGTDVELEFEIDVFENEEWCE